MAESADFDDAGAIAVSIGSTNLAGTGLAKEAGGNLQTARSMLDGSAAGALVGTPGNTVALETAALMAGGATTATPGGVPMLHGHKQLFTVTGQVIAASGVYSPANIVFSKPGYHIRILAQMSAAGAAMPSLHMAFTWRSSASGSAVVDAQDWYVPAGATQNRRAIIKGPVTGDTLSLQIFNGDAVDSCTITLAVYETTHALARHDGRGDNAVAYSGVTGINNQAGALVLGNDSFTVAANSTVVKSLPLYAGQVNIWINQNIAAGSQVNVSPAGDFDTALPSPITTLDWTQPFTTAQGVILPRVWCTLQFVNKAAGIVTASVTVTALEYAT